MRQIRGSSGGGSSGFGYKVQNSHDGFFLHLHALKSFLSLTGSNQRVHFFCLNAEKKCNALGVFSGPPPNWIGPPPCKGCEVFIGKVPRDVYEYELVRARFILKFLLTQNIGFVSRNWYFNSKFPSAFLNLYSRLCYHPRGWMLNLSLRPVISF